MSDLKNKIYILLVFVACFSSCNDDKFFELERPPASPWQTTGDIELGVVAAYHHTFYHSWSNYYSQDRVLFDVMSDVHYLLPGAAANVPFNEMYFRTTEIPEIEYTTTPFDRCYKTIGSANVVLDFINDNDRRPFGNMTDKDDQNIDRMEGEMLTLRAFAYYHLALVHAPTPGSANFTTERVLPLRLTFPKTSEEASSPEFVTGARIYEVMIADLKAAKEVLPDGYDPEIHPASYSLGRVDRYVAAAILSKVYFQLGEYDLALIEIDEVLEGPFALDQDPIESFNRNDRTKANEVVWSAFYGDLNINQAPKPYTVITKNPYWALNGGRGESFDRGTWNLWPIGHGTSKMIGWMDDELAVTTEALRDKRYKQLYYRFEGNRGSQFDDPKVYEMNWTQVKEPFIWGDKYFRAPIGSASNVPVIRLGELLLTSAIIKFNDGDLQGAVDDLNTVRERAWDENWNMDQDGNVIAVDPFVPVTVGNITADMIHQERIKELATEGDRLNYLRALRLPIPSGDRESTAAIDYPYESLRWDIPINELNFKQGND